MSAPLTAADRSFLRSILDHPEEVTTWLAYADWLDDRGDPRAEFLRLTAEGRSPLLPPERAAEIAARLALLMAELDPNWTLVFETGRVDNCRGPEWRFVCPGTWDALAPTDEPDIRICHQCRSPVFFCQTPDEAREFASAGQCVALSTRVPDGENPFRVREVVMVGWYDGGSGEYPAAPPVLPPPPRRPWWKFW